MDSAIHEMTCGFIPQVSLGRRAAISNWCCYCRVLVSTDWCEPLALSEQAFVRLAIDFRRHRVARATIPLETMNSKH